MALIRLARLGRKLYFEECITTYEKQFSSVSLNPIPGLNVYNSLSKEKSPIFTKHPNVLTWYICGPTVYDFSHIGHAWCYVNFDIMRRIMEQYFNLNVVQVMNITDIDDKIIQKAIDEKLDFKEVSSKYEISFLNDLDNLSVQRPSVLTKVTDFIPQIISFIATLLHQKLAYTTSDGSVYFSLNAYSKKYKYGKLKPSQVPLMEAENQNRRPNQNEDFALWKATKSSSEPSWSPSWGGKGRPGWHIECSAMASHIFGSWVDVHSGGIDLLFPHHENEEAQCCAYHGTSQWVGHWIHSNLLHLPNGAKMSKSLKNSITVREFLETYSAEQFRMMCVISNYRNGMDFTEDSLRLAKDMLDTFRTFITECRFYIRNSSSCQSSIDSNFLFSALEETKSKVEIHLGDDFNTAEATKIVRKLVQLTRKEMNDPKTFNTTKSDCGIAAVASVQHFVSKYLNTLGFKLTDISVSSAESDSASIIDDFVGFRSQIRQHALAIKKGDKVDPMNTKKILLAACDNLREDLKLKGIQLKDHEKNTTWTLTK
ncbi:probable cysteine--tRNA ligase, mitochondrial [Daphnia pulex]|uniref:probable cysteine--tRNA ligase, mitochondrial n=1 Tax=Daphnia pulex TaxID=6669 RepID=UPI001EE08519|nr:probable cysteine--tRNA ligase, mitochondrial [Daphnia pulex]XP_046461970.1 probable cysteine--tRNA ligase, mitochondrial [Daphnia pulex]